MANPGFSLSELITAAGQCKTIYEAFFNKHTNSATQIRYLAETIDEFKSNLETHRAIIEQRGLEYGGYEVIGRTLAECTDLLKKYSVLLEDKKITTEKAYKTARYAYEQDVPKRLLAQIANHYHTLHFSMSAIIMDSLRTSNMASQQIAIAGHSAQFVSPPQIPNPLSEDLLSGQEIPSPGSPSAISMLGTSPAWNTTPGQTARQRQASIQTSPRSVPAVPSTPNEFNLTLPEPALPAQVAKLYLGSPRWVSLNRNASGGDLPKGTGRELVVATRKGAPKLKHQIKLPAGQICYPYTWHSCWGKKRELQVSFVGMPVEAHAIKVSGRDQALGAENPWYEFTSITEYKRFQGEVRGKELVGYFEFRQIKTESSSNYGEATDQHLKIWKHRISQDHSISFFASAAANTGDLEFPISMFYQEIDSKDEIGLEVDLEVVLQFSIAGKSQRRDSRKPSRSATLTTTASFDPSLFSRVQTGFSASPSIPSTMTSRNSVASFGSDSSPPQTDKKKSLTVLEEQAKRMKKLNIEFSDAKEAARFRRLFSQVYTEENTRLSDFVLDWQLGANTAGPGSSISNASTPGSPTFPMSPVMRSQQSPEIRPQR